MRHLFAKLLQLLLPDDARVAKPATIWLDSGVGQLLALQRLVPMTQNIGTQHWRKLILPKCAKTSAESTGARNSAKGAMTSADSTGTGRYRQTGQQHRQAKSTLGNFARVGNHTGKMQSHCHCAFSPGGAAISPDSADIGKIGQ